MFPSILEIWATFSLENIVFCGKFYGKFISRNDRNQPIKPLSYDNSQLKLGSNKHVGSSARMRFTMVPWFQRSMWGLTLDMQVYGWADKATPIGQWPKSTC